MIRKKKVTIKCVVFVFDLLRGGGRWVAWGEALRWMLLSQLECYRHIHLQMTIMYKI